MKIFNRRAKFDYQILEKFETGIVLTGADVKAFRSGQLSLNNAHARFVGSEVFLISPTRTWKLLLHKKEIISIAGKLKAKKLTLVPTSMYTKGNLVKVQIALAKAKRQFEKKESIKKRDIEREQKQGDV